MFNGIDCAITERLLDYLFFFGAIATTVYGSGRRVALMLTAMNTIYLISCNCHSTRRHPCLYNVICDISY